MNKKVSVIGVGNILLRDEGIGVHVVEELRVRYQFDERVSLVDGGTGGFSLLRHIKDTDLLILIDAMDTGLEPATVSTLEFPPIHNKIFTPLPSHLVGVFEIIHISQAIYRYPAKVKIIGIQPADTSIGIEISPKVRTIIPKLISLILEELKKWGFQPLHLLSSSFGKDHKKIIASG
jgi:hydrogenase maturation protease